MDQPGLWVLLAILVILAIGAASLFCFLKSPGRARAERHSRMQGLAEGLGLRYYGDADKEALSALPEFYLLGEAGTTTISNLMGERRRPPRAVLFELQRSVPRGPLAGDPTAPLLHLVAMAAPGGGAPITAARVYRDDWFGGPVGVEGLYRLEFKDDPAFSSGYHLSGEPRAAVSAMLTEPLRRALKSWSLRGPRPVVEFLRDWVVVYVESGLYDKNVAAKGEAVLRYAGAIAGALSGDASAVPLPPQRHPG